ncbi:putative pollen allergen Ole e 1 family [Dioscorea sansibarensis]
MGKNQIPMAVVLFFFVAAACYLPINVSAARNVPAKNKFIVEGKVFCDSCQFGYETPLSSYIAGAKVRVECRDKATGVKTCDFDGVTDHTGTYNIYVADEHEHENCETVLLSSPHPECAKLVAGRERAVVFLTHNNGIASDKRFANAMGFQKDTPLPQCAELKKLYDEYDV